MLEFLFRTLLIVGTWILGTYIITDICYSCKWRVGVAKLISALFISVNFVWFIYTALVPFNEFTYFILLLNIFIAISMVSTIYKSLSANEWKNV